MMPDALMEALLVGHYSSDVNDGGSMMMNAGPLV